MGRHPFPCLSLDILRQDRLIRSHVGDMPRFIERLSDAHGALRIHMKECTGLLLERACHERVRGRLRPWFRGGLEDRRGWSGMNELQIILCGLLIFQFVVHRDAKGWRGRGRKAHGGRQFPAGRGLKRLDRILPLHHQTKRRGLAAPRG